MSVLGAYLLPHPPILIPEVGGNRRFEAKETLVAIEKVRMDLQELKPDTIVVLTPHHHFYADYFHVSPGEAATGSLAAFGASQVHLNVKYDTAFIERIDKAAADLAFPCGTKGEKEKMLDHGSMVPLLQILPTDFQGKIVRICVSGLNPKMHFRLGELLRDLAEKIDQRILLLASADLSHRCSQESPYGYDSAGPQFDQQITQAISDGNMSSVVKIDPSLARAAGECGWRSLQVLAGYLDQRSYESKLLSYECPFGIGYAVAIFHQVEQMNELNPSSFARQALKMYLEEGRHFSPVITRKVGWMEDRKGAFVSIKNNGELRGCIGTIEPVQDNTIQEIIENAIAAGTRDPRFKPISKDELEGLEISVDLLDKAEVIPDETFLDPKIYGVIVVQGRRRGVLLPDLEGIDSPEKQLNIAMRKGGIEPMLPYQIYRFKVVRYR